VSPVGEGVGSTLFDKIKAGLGEICGPVILRSRGHNNCAPRVDISTSAGKDGLTESIDLTPPTLQRDRGDGGIQRHG